MRHTSTAPQRRHLRRAAPQALSRAHHPVKRARSPGLSGRTGRGSLDSGRSPGNSLYRGGLLLGATQGVRHRHGHGVVQPLVPGRMGIVRLLAVTVRGCGRRVPGVCGEVSHRCSPDWPATLHATTEARPRGRRVPTSPSSKSTAAAVAPCVHGTGPSASRWWALTPSTVPTTANTAARRTGSGTRWVGSGWSMARSSWNIAMVVGRPVRKRDRCLTGPMSPRVPNRHFRNLRLVVRHHGAEMDWAAV